MKHEASILHFYTLCGLIFAISRIVGLFAEINPREKFWISPFAKINPREIFRIS